MALEGFSRERRVAPLAGFVFLTHIGPKVRCLKTLGPRGLAAQFRLGERSGEGSVVIDHILSRDVTILLEDLCRRHVYPRRPRGRLVYGNHCNRPPVGINEIVLIKSAGGTCSVIEPANGADHALTWILNESGF